MIRIKLLSTVVAACTFVGGVVAAENYQSTCGGGDPGKVHPNGGGWVPVGQSHDGADTYLIAESVYVGPNSIVCGGTISGNVRIINSTVWGGTISGAAVIRNSTVGQQSGGYTLSISENVKIVSSVVRSGTIFGSVRIRHGVNISENAVVHGSAKLSGTGTRVSGNGEVSGNAVIRGGSWVFGNGKVNCGRWNGVDIRNDQRGRCGKNGQSAQTDESSLSEIGSVSNPIDPQNTESN